MIPTPPKSLLLTPLFLDTVPPPPDSLPSDIESPTESTPSILPSVTSALPLLPPTPSLHGLDNWIVVYALNSGVSSSEVRKGKFPSADQDLYCSCTSPLQGK
ncbi:hypothetical protein NE237_023981 [Protea cynaroides]|uniref:Uncharacterized protein n=1 Tax=Protea cynaroides TaxID=273540 RepID=A0A9Q0HCS9_9MAGN|nr:hypothetical protein NE237_023981 [Protea cynaroides]